MDPKVRADPQTRAGFLFRLLRTWLICSAYFGIACVTVPLVYYLVKGSSDFDFFLRDTTGAGLRWAVRVGGWEFERSPNGESWTSFGLSVRDAERIAKIDSGRLAGTYQATYLASVRDRPFPTILLVVKDVAPNGTANHLAVQLGLLPALKAACYILLSALGAGAVVEVVAEAKRRGQRGNRPRRWVSNV